MITTTAQSVVSPSIARYHAEGRLGDLKRLLLKISLGAGAATVVVSLGVLALFELLVPVIGSSFAEARAPLLILTLAYAVSAVLFSGLPLLLMSGNVGSVALANAVAIAVNLLLNWLLIPELGASGTALATLASLTMLHLLHLGNVYRRLWRTANT
jgi:O-antigen/teichoic acid export membrane protein